MTRKLPGITDGANPKPGECENGGVSQTSRFRGRGKDISMSLPRGETLATFDAYASAQKLINSLVSDGVPFRSLSIVGTDVNLVERVTGKIGYGRAALSSAMSGSWLGVLAGLVFVIVSPTDVITPIVAGGIYGAGIGTLIFLIRKWGNYPDAVAFAVLLMNFGAPLIDHYTQPKTYGHQKKSK